MLGPLRTLISVAFLAISLWAAFTIKLGRFTFADVAGVDEAKQEVGEIVDFLRTRASSRSSAARFRRAC